MTDNRIEPHKVTKPIQLLAAWLVGLILVSAIFLTAAVELEGAAWERRALVISAIVNVPLFLLALFVLQTRFRAELQEDTYYSEYLSKKTAAVIRIDKELAQDSRLEELEQMLRIKDIRSTSVGFAGNVGDELNWTPWKVALNEVHPRFDEIREALRSASIPLAEIFGANVPSKWIISLSHRMPVAHKARLLDVVLPFGFDGILFWEPLRDAEENEDVYIGSYGDVPYAPVTAELQALLKGRIEEVDFKRYLKRYTVDASAEGSARV